MRGLSGRVAIVTGAGGGIGAATVGRLVEEGAQVLATDVDLDAVQAAVAPFGDAVVSMAHDVAVDGAWADVFAAAVERFGAPTILVNNAGIFRIGPLAQLDGDTLDRVMAVNVRGVALGMKHAARGMTDGGAIVNVSSVAGIVGTPLHTIYGASKGAVRAMTKSAAAELGRQRVRVNSVHPAIIDTAMATAGLALLGRTEAQLVKAYPMRRFGKAHEVAAAICFLASDDASYMTGSELVVDGGLTAM